MKATFYFCTVCFFLLAIGCSDWVASGDQGGLVMPEKRMRLRVSEPAFVMFAPTALPAVGNDDPVPGMLDTFVVYNANGQTRVGFSWVFYNASTTTPFHIDTMDESFDVPNFGRTELLTINGELLQTAAKTAYTVSDSHPVEAGFPSLGLWHTLSPRWADVYEWNTSGQSFNLSGLDVGRYQLRYTFDPLQIYGQYQTLTATVIWDGVKFYAVQLPH